MAQLESGKTYIVPNVGMRDYVNEKGNSHTSEEYFIWLANKIKTGLNLDLKYNIISDGYLENSRHCFLELPYINNPTKNRLHLYLEARNDYLSSLIPKISYSNGENYFISVYECLPYIIHYNQQGAVHLSERDGQTKYWSHEYSSRNRLTAIENGTFVLDTTYLDSSGFYNIYFMRNIRESESVKIDKAIFTPRIFICDMIDVFTKEHFDCVFSLPNIPGESYTYDDYAGYTTYGGPRRIGQPSIAAIGVNKKREYTLQGFVPQIFTVDLDKDDLHYNNNIHSNSMIRLQFGRMRAYKDIYILLGNSMLEMKKYCKQENIVENHFSWYKDALKINNDKYSLSCSCYISNYTQNFFRTPQWAIAIKDDEKPKPEVKGYLEFSSDGDFYLRAQAQTWNGGMEYSVDDGSTWEWWHGNRINGTSTQNILIRGIRNNIITGDSSVYCSWIFTGKYIEGNIETLLDYQMVLNGEHPSMQNYCYADMFYNCTSLIKAPELSATTLADYCYSSMFYNCTSLIEAPELPATELEVGCYREMFYRCTSLTKAPELPAITLEKQCYSSMFKQCTSLTEAPKLPATTLAEVCYESMFFGCASLIKVPKLPATELEVGCYGGMFCSCNSLIEIPKLPTTRLVDSCYYRMFESCFKIKISLTQDAKYLYEYRIPKEGTGTTARDALYHMFTYTGGTFTGTPKINTTYYTSNEVV